MDAVIRVTHVSKKFRIYSDRPLTLKERIVRGARGAYRDFYALKDVSFEVKRGSTIGLIGKNGSGKSTLLKLINRTMFPDEGSISIEGKVASLIELGAGFHPELSGRENIYTNASVFGFSKEEIEKRIPDIIRFSELEEFIDNPIRTYSSGMYARLAFSVAIHVDPDILLVDEILGVGDLNFQKKCTDKIYEMRKNGTTIIVVTHDMGSVEKLCDYCIWLDNGSKIDEGRPHDIQNRYIEFMAKKQEQQSYHDEKMRREIQSDTVSPSSSQDKVSELGHHFGTGEITLTDVKLLDRNRVDKRSFHADEPFSLVVSYACNVSPETLSINIGVEIHTAEGVLVAGTNTSRDGIGQIKLSKTGVFEIAFREMSLVEGTYHIGTAISNESETIHYDYYHRIASFTVYSGFRGVGIIQLRHDYIVDGETLHFNH